ncbi:hypothetical protein TNCV_1500111 [Trichonephila clavipes]|nr:hypothetical protein TNCV_1500111 [Trichonephila clavipes]
MIHFSARQHDTFADHLIDLPSYWHGTGGEGNILQVPPPGVSAATANMTFGPTDLTSTYSMCTRRVFGGIGHRAHVFRHGFVRHFNAAMFNVRRDPGKMDCKTTCGILMTNLVILSHSQVTRTTPELAFPLRAATLS